MSYAVMICLKRYTGPALITLIIFLYGGCVNTEEDTTVPAKASEFANLVNQHRDTKCSNSLTWNTSVFQVAQAHSQDMKDRSFFSHDNPDGKSPFDRLTDAGISYSAAAENIAKGQSTAQEVLNAWLNSSGHKTNIENCTYTEHGVGYVADGNYWTHVFIKP